MQLHISGAYEPGPYTPGTTFTLTGICVNLMIHIGKYVKAKMYLQWEVNSLAHSG